MYTAIPADTERQGKGALAHVCQVLVELGVRIKSGKIKQPKGERLPGAVNTEGYLGPGGSMGVPAVALLCVFYKLTRAWSIWW